MTTMGNARVSRNIGRFVFTDLIDERGGSELWRAKDSSLGRDVLIRLLPLSDPRALELEEAAVAAASAECRNLVKVLDVLNTGSEVAVVTEYVVGRSLTEYLSEPLPPGDAARIALEVSRGLEVAHANGIAHGRIRPSHVVIADNGEIKVAGLGVDGVLLGLDPIAAGDPLGADIHGTGSILYTCLTGKWPDGPLEGISAAPRVGKHVPPPARVLADVPEALDLICARTVLTIVPPRNSKRFTVQEDVTAALASAMADLGRAWSEPVGVAPSYGWASPKGKRLWQGAAIVGGIGALALTGWALSSNNKAPVASPLPEPSGAASAAPSPAEIKESVFPIQEAADFDPLGNDEENPGLVDRAIDNNPDTAWRTVVYFQKNLGKGGVGLLLDLGSPQAVSTVKLSLLGNGSDVEVRTSMNKSEKPSDYKVLASAKEAGEKTTVRAPRPQLARYVLVWFTDLPPTTNGYRGGIKDVKVLG